MTTTKAATPAMAASKVRIELPEPERATVRWRAMRNASFGVHWIWHHGEERYTAAGLRLIAEAYDAEHDEAAAVVCRRMAEELDRETVRSEPGEDDFRARRWDLKEGES